MFSFKNKTSVETLQLFQALVCSGIFRVVTLTTKPNNPQDIDLIASLTPSLPSQLSTTQPLFEGYSIDLSHVDNILITGTTPVLIHDLITKLHAKFTLKQLGIPKYFIEIKVQYHKNGFILLTQSKYIKDLLNKVNMKGVNGVTTPIFNCKLSKHGPDALSDPSMYRSTVGSPIICHSRMP